MEVFKLDPTTFKPSTTIKNIESVTWVERYQSEGDFQIIVDNDASVLTNLPGGTLISHNDTYQVMIVENHEITRDKDKQLKIIVTGRTFETFAENRNTLVSELSLYEATSGTANVDLYTTEAENLATWLLEAGLVEAFAPAGNGIPNLSIVTEIRELDPTVIYAVKRGDLYTVVMELLRLSDAGLKSSRPHGSEQTTLDLVIHDGRDLTTNVIFYAQYEDLEDAKYFWSIKNYKNYARIAGHIATRFYQHRDLVTPQVGLDRRILYLEADDLEGTYEPPSNTDELATRAQLALDQYKKVSLLTAKVSLNAKPKFKINYDIGDLVTVFGEFSTEQVMRVTEHILTYDKSGMRGFPSLTIL